MRRHHPSIRTARGLAAAASAATALALVVAVGAPADASPGVQTTAASAGATHASAPLRPGQFDGVNWADPNDNYANGPVVPSGLSTSDSYAQTYAKASAIVAGFRANLHANTVRLPVNPYSVGTAWWQSYRAAIDAAEHSGFKVVLGYWEGTGTAKDGKVDDPAAWWSMWNTLTSTYRHDPAVYFEPMNEPFGYSEADWAALATQWVQRYDNVIPRDRMFISGAGYNDHVGSVCSVAALDGTYLSLHDYGFWGTRTYSEWLGDFATRIGGCADRTVLDEFGSPMTTGIDYSADSTSSDPETNNYVAYLQAATDTVRALGMGSIYWPGLRNGDIYSMETLHGSGTALWLTTNNDSGARLIQWGWGRGHTAPHVAE
ncbi:MAG TPA: cellulase family glycosylhydrolase [Humibacter sp.]|nr:cellulase family glycosylhydrolase [Humibacter sp.]